MSDDLREAISAAAAAIVAARDFCGDERTAALAAFLERKVAATPEVLAEAYAKADAQWRESQKAAGVKPEYWRGEAHTAVCEGCGTVLDCEIGGCTEPEGHPGICEDCLEAERRRPEDPMLARMELRYDD